MNQKTITENYVLPNQKRSNKACFVVCSLILSENKQHCIANSPAIEVSTVKKATPSGQKARTEVLVFQPLYYVYI